LYWLDSRIAFTDSGGREARDSGKGRPAEEEEEEEEEARRVP